jgi:hypothetical protein
LVLNSSISRSKTTICESTPLLAATCCYSAWRTQVHRSYWVGRHAVASIERDGHRARLVLTTAHHLPDTGLGGRCVHRPNVRSPRFRRDPFVRDVVFDHGRASVPRITGPHMLPSTLLTVSASAEFWFSRLNSTPHTITVYASHPPSPATTQHSLQGARYGLPGPVSHRRDHASLTWRTSNPSFSHANHTPPG